jgi:serine/threonine protein phosphatase PrpC
LELDLGKDDKFIVLASDGVWEFLQNDDVAQIVKPFFDTKNAEKAAEAVVRESYLRWKREEEGIVDDITCIIIFLDVKMEQQELSENLLQAERELLESTQQHQQQQAKEQSDN